MAADDRIRAVRLDAFRGATGTTAIRFDASKPVVLIYGENGTGKSSIVDAIDAVCNATAGSLRDRSSTRVGLHVPALGARPDDVRVTLESGRGTYQARVIGESIRVHPAYDGPPVAVLRRAGLLSLVNAEPGARFEVLERFVDVKGVESSENALASAARDAGLTVTRLGTELAQAEHALDELWIGAGRPSGSATAWAGEQADLALDAIEADSARANAVATAADELRRDVDGASNCVIDHDAAREARDAAVTALAERSRAGHGRELAEVLVAAQRALAAAPDSAECPVCERSTDVAALGTRLTERLEAARALTEAVAALERAEHLLRMVEERRQRAETRVVSSARKLAVLLTVERLEAALQPAVRTLRGESSDVPDGDAANALGAQAAKLRDVAYGHAARLQRRIEGARFVKAALDQVVTRRHEMNDATRGQGRLQEALHIVRTQRTSFVQEVLDAVRDDSNRFYEQLHPGEGIGLRRLRLEEGKRKSLHQEAQFGERTDVPPQAYFSESHLDTFGFVFWLAVTRHAASGAATRPIIVLDDVFASTDAAHAARALSLIVAEREAFAQVIVATHQREWVDSAPREFVDVVQLGDWSLGGGIVTA